MEGGRVLKALKKAGFVLLMAAGYVLTAALFIYFFPLILQMMFTGEWERHRNFVKKVHRIREQVKHEIYLRKQHEARAKRSWENRNNFYKESEKAAPVRESWHAWYTRKKAFLAKRAAENRNNFYKETTK